MLRVAHLSEQASPLGAEIRAVVRRRAALNECSIVDVATKLYWLWFRHTRVRVAATYGHDRSIPEPLQTPEIQRKPPKSLEKLLENA